MLTHSPVFQANCIDSTAAPEAVFASEVKKMQQENMKPQEQLTLEPYERDHAVVVGMYRYGETRGHWWNSVCFPRFGKVVFNPQ